MIVIKRKRIKLLDMFKKGVLLKLVLVLVFQFSFPTVTLALTSGPSQPEVQSFEPIGTSDMVDVFSGDFTYNVPLLDVEGYPINLSYHSGITMDQEASWCGLGWNINPGVVNRSMRGIPDDFSGDVVTKQYNIKKNATVGVSTGFSGELFGLDFASFNARVGIKYNNYNGVGIEKSFNVSVSASNKCGGSGSVSLGITSSSDDGLSVQPSISLSQSMSKSDKSSTSAGVSIGASFNSRGGLSKLTVGTSVSVKVGTGGNDNKNASYSESGPSASFNFGSFSYSPSVDFPMENLSITGNFKLGGEVFGFDGSLSVGGYYMEQRIATNSVSNPAYGYMNSQYGQNVSSAMLDYNREKDGSFTSATYNLPLTSSTFDIFSVSGQGAGGSYRPFRSDVGHVFDASSSSTSDGYDIGVEVGLGNLTHVGVNVVVNTVNTSSGDWTSSNISSMLQSRNSASYNDYEPYYFKEANEKSVNSDNSFYDNFGGDKAARFDLDGATKFNAVTTGNLELSNSAIQSIPSNYRNARDKRSQTISILTNNEVKDGFGIEDIQNNYITNNLNTVKSIGHHIGQISSLGADGKRYVYGLPLYNITQEETSFAVGVPEGGGSARSVDSEGLVTYSPGSDNTQGNSMGLDNYFNNIVMPAYAHSYLLTSVISPDYVDLDNIKGPSDNDAGTYVKFKYKDVTSSNLFKWRTPLGKNKAKYNDGLFSSDNDDKGSYVYGEKQVCYLKEIETKNYIAKFWTSKRTDALGVKNKDGEVDNSASAPKQEKLDSIQLFSKSAGALDVVKTVHFRYDYELCEPTVPTATLPNNKTAYIAPSSSSNKVGGKLTLKKVFFTYQSSDKGAFNAYNFKYAGQFNTTGPKEPGLNPSYTMKQTDRWGNYKASNTPSSLPFDAFPYSNQYIGKSTIDQWSYAWHLTKIELPSGGEINVNYEADDYAYVQNEQATQMYPILNSTTSSDFSSGVLKVSVPSGTDINDLLPDDNLIYFRFRMELRNGKYDYVPGYAEIDRSGCQVVGTTAIIQLQNSTINDNGGQNVNPITKATIQFGRLNNSRLVWDQPNASASMSEQMLKALVNSGFFQNIQQTLQGPNKYLLDQGVGLNPDLSKSWIKLKNTTGYKYGGGNRVKSVVLKDQFSKMVSGAENSEYGQVYEYTTTDNKGKVISSGVANYEPQIGGEENALKHPFFTETKRLLAPDDEHYAEAPFGESFYPSASIGYSKVKVKNYVPNDPIFATKTLKRHSTGYIIHEFYTSKEFPTITDRTGLEAIQHKNDPFSLASLFSIESKDYMTTSQGFYVELNDMHGKPKSQKVYAEDQISPISSTEYRYKSTPYGNGTSRLTNSCTVLYSDGTVKNENIGLFFDAVADLREQETSSESYGLNVNVDGFLILAVPVFIPVPIPSYTSDYTKFRSAVLTKVVQRFGILEETITNNDGSIVSSKNLAYDAETGNVLLTQINNNYDDPIYGFKYPAYWHYPGMGLAYKNINYRINNVMFNGTGFANISSSQNKFIEGDEVELEIGSGSSVIKSLGWVTDVTSSGITVQKKDGGTINGLYNYIKVIRSGHRNLIGIDMANITTLSNPLSGIKNNIFDKVTQATAVEFANRWKSSCECNMDPAGNQISSNPYVIGTKGTWKTIKNYVYLTGRTQSDYNNNTNIRKDGVFKTYTPFYKLASNGKWQMDNQNWTNSSEVTAFNQFGNELENVDALGRYSSASYGYNQTLATATSVNSQFREQGYDSFEDVVLMKCADKHFKIGTSLGQLATDAHTGKYSLLVAANSTKSLEKQIASQCPTVKDCNGSITYNVFTSVYEVNGTFGAINIDYHIISGSGAVYPSVDGKGFVVTKFINQPISIKVVVTDEKGCNYSTSINF